MMKLEEFLKAGNRIAVYKIGEVPIIKKPILRCDLLKRDMSEVCDNGDPMIGVRIADAKQYIQKTAKPPAFLRLRDIYGDFDLDEKLSNETHEKINNKMDNEKIYTLRGLYDYLVMHRAVNFNDRKRQESDDFSRQRNTVLFWFSTRPRFIRTLFLNIFSNSFFRHITNCANIV